MAANKHEIYYFDRLITIQVEDTLFRVPRKEFVEQSEVFRNMFMLPPGNDAVEDGQSDEHPLRLEGITSSDFFAFLKALYHRPALFHDKPLTDEEMSTALRLAKMWCFDDFRKSLIASLESLNLAPARKLQLARTHDIRHWYKPELRILAFRKDSLTLDEGVQLGPRLATMVSILRDERYNTIVSCGVSGPTHTSYYEGDMIEKANRVDMKGRIDRGLAEFSRDHHWND